MLQSIRDYIQGWIAGIIISLIILSFALFGIHSYFTGLGASNVVAKVNGVEITKSELAGAYDRMRRQMQFNGNYNLSENAEAALKEQALQALVEIQVLKQASVNADYRISYAQVDSYLQSMPIFQVNGEFSIDRFQQVLATTLFNANDFRELIKTNLLIDQPRLGVALTSFALPNEVDEAMALVGQEREIQYLTIPPQYFVNQKVPITDDAIKSYYEHHQDDFRTQEQVSIQYITLSAKDLQSRIQPTEQEIKNYYDENTSSFTQPAKWQLQNILIPVDADQNVTLSEQAATRIAKEWKEGKELSALKKEFTNLVIHENASWATLNDLPVDVQKEVATLNKVKQVSAPIKTKEGWLIIKVTGYNEPQLQSYAAAKDKVKMTLTHQRAEERFAELREKLANLTYEHPDSLESAAKELSLPLQTSALITKTKGSSDLTSNPKIREAAFTNDVLNLRNNSDVIQVDADTVAVIRVKSHVPAAILSLDVVRNQIIEKLKASWLTTQMQQFANQLKKELQSGTRPDQLATQVHLSWSKAEFMGRRSAKVNQAILDTAFTLPKPANGVIAYEVTRVANGMAIVAVSAVKDGAIESSKEQYQAYAQQIQNSQGMLEYELYKNSLMSKAKIKIE